jgi:NAD(P)-dependent dehydrogenase (short-subunit alcohol dehydrogenase family)
MEDRAPRGLVVMVTGATSGLGRLLAERLASLGATVVVHGRDVGRVHDTCDAVARLGGTPMGCTADFASISEVTQAARTLNSGSLSYLDALINNAGVGPGAPGAARELSRDGHELRFAVNYLAPYLLTRALLPLLARGVDPRIVNVVSGSQTAIELDDLQMDRGYEGWTAYRRAKLALVSFTMDLAAELGDAVRVVSVHPADLMPTRLVADTGLTPVSTLNQGADAVLAALLAPRSESPTGAFYAGTTSALPHADALDPARRRALRLSTERLLAVGPPASGDVIS